MQVIAEHLSVEEVAGIKEAFQLMDVDNKGKVSLDQLRNGIQKLGQQIPDPDLQILMEAVSINLCFTNLSFILFNLGLDDDCSTLQEFVLAQFFFFFKLGFEDKRNLKRKCLTLEHIESSVAN